VHRGTPVRSAVRPSTGSVIALTAFTFLALSAVGVRPALGAAPPPPGPPAPTTPAPGAPGVTGAPGAPGAQPGTHPGATPQPPQPQNQGQNPTAILLAPKVGVVCPEQPLPPGVEVTPKSGTVTLNRRPTISVKFSEPVDQAKLVVQVDSDDVTAALERAESQITYSPPADLRPGLHRIAVQGGPAPIEWCFAQRRFEGVEDLGAGGELSVTEEFAMKKAGQESARNKLDGNLHLVGRAAEGNAVAITEWNLRYGGTWNPTHFDREPIPPTSVPRGVVDGVDVPNFHTVFTYKDQMAELGDVNIQESTLVAPSFARRGAQIKLVHPFWSSEAHFFGARPQSDSTSRHLTGLDEDGERAFGGSVAFSPFVPDPAMFRLKAVLVSGESQNQSAPSIAGASSEQTGTTWSFQGTSSLFENRVKAEGEYAVSRFSPAVADGFNRQNDSAARGHLDLQDSSLQLLEKPVQFKLAGEYNFIGLFYRSIANPGIPSDREGVNAEGGTGWGPANVSLNAARAHDNVRNLSVLPEVWTTTRGAAVALAQPEWPSLTLSATRTNQESVKEPAPITTDTGTTAPIRVDNIVNTLQAQASYTWQFLTVNVGVTKTQTLDFTRQTRNNNIIALNGGLSLNLFDGRLTISPTITRTDTDTQPTDDRAVALPGSSVFTRTTVYTLTATGAIIPSELTFDGQLSLTDTNTRSENSGLAGGTTPQGRTVTTNAMGRLTWNFEKYLWNYGRQALSLRVNWNRIVDSVSPLNDRNDLGVFLILDVFAPFLF
jgi:hypothetical protein